jgi:hypothetical protein
MICYDRCVMEGKVGDLVTLFESCAIQHFIKLEKKTRGLVAFHHRKGGPT